MIKTKKPPLFWVALLILLFASVISALVGPHSEYFVPPASATWIAPPPPQGAGYAYRRTITIDHTKVPNTDQSNFPVLISGTYSYLATVANGGNVQNANGYDVIFTSDVGCATKLDHEVQSYSATNGAVNYWVRVPTVSHTVDTTIYLCYGNSAITTDQSNKTGVWDSNFKAVYHLEDQAASTSVSDSSANGTNGTNAANTSGKTVTGMLGRALTYNGTSDNMSTGVTQTSSFTWECWFKLTDWTTQSGSSNYSTLMAGTYASGGGLLMLWKDSAYVVQFASDNAGGVTSGANSVAPGAWHHAAYTRTGNGGTYSLYFDGVLKGQVAGGTLSPSTTIMLARRADATAQALNGLLDEARISNVARSADWIKTEYNNQSSPSTFYSISATSCCDTLSTRLDPMSATGGGGENPLSRNFNWNLPLVQLPGRAGLDLGISLAYNSLVWAKSGSSYISFDDDHGFPSPGFRLGFPVIQQYFNTQLNQNGYLFIAADGSRTELRQVVATSLYQAVDSSYLLLDSSTMRLRTGDGTQLSYALLGTDFQCTEIKDRNGNYITINYTNFARVDTVVDTLGRTVKFNYDVSNALTSITQTWTVNGSAVTHTWASFEYRNPNLTISTNFNGLTPVGAQNGSTIKVLSKVTLADSSRFEFDYTSWGQVWKISAFANDGVTLLNYRSYNLPVDNSTVQTDCPRFTQRHDWAKYWNRDVSGNEQEATTAFIEPTPATWTMPDSTQQSGTLAQVTAPDGTYDKIYSHSTGWEKGLSVLTETYDSSQTRQRQITTAWTQDNTSLTIPLNPRITEANTYDPQGNRKRVRTTYQQISLSDGTDCSLPQDVFEYQADATIVLRSTRTTYNTSSAYTTRRIIGLVSERALYDGDVTLSGTLAAKSSYQYDESGSIQSSDAPVQHDNTNYTSAFVVGRANLSSTKRYDVTNLAQFTTTSSKYNTAGALVSETDASNHTAQVTYTDSFSDGVTRNTLAYPTTFTDPDGYAATAKYNFDFGAATYGRKPQPNTTNNVPGPEQTFTYDSIGRLDRVTSLVNNAYTRYIYGPNYVRTYSTVNTVADEAHSLSIMDGAGRVIAAAQNHPGSVGGYSGQLTVYDAMGRAVKKSNPTETSVTVPSPAAPINPYGWAAAGDDATPGWIYSQQTYDWKGRPRITTNQDGTTKTASYTGCGCAGGEVVTVTDEGTIDNGVAKRRQQKLYADVLGRSVKTEVLNWEGGSVFSATVTSYNVRDQVTQVREYAGAEGNPTYQDTTTAYDGYGRVQSRHAPEQDLNTATTWTYNADDTVNTITDARGAVTTLSYTGTNRQLVKQITHTLTGSPTITTSFTYDAFGNRLSMTDSAGSVSYSYNQLAQLTSEARSFTNLGTFTLAYSYNLAGELSSITDPWGAVVGYNYDAAGRLNAVTGSGFAELTSYASNLQYRASGTVKSLTYGNTKTLALGYNTNLQVSSYEIPNVMKKSYQYYDDGQLKFTQDQLTVNSKFDRLYQYDHMGRITKALTGQEARGGATTNDRPYNENIGYDAVGHLVLREIRQWDRYDTTGTETYTNNRRFGWLYDADGRLTSGNGYYYYDAAGQIYSFGDWDPYKTDQVLDGDGKRVKSTLQSYDANTNQWTIEQVRYYIHSSVLGQVLTEINEGGAKQRTFVYAGGQILAIQSIDVNQVVTWEGYDPSGSSYRATDAQAAGVNSAEMDPLGGDAGLMKPLTWNPPTSSGKLEPYYGVPELNSASQGCELEGMPIPCDLRNELMESGALRNEVLVHTGNGWHTKQAPVIPHGVGLFTTFSFYINNTGEPADVRVFIRLANSAATEPTASNLGYITREQLMERIKKNLKKCGKRFKFDINADSLIAVSSQLPIGVVLVTGADHIGNAGNSHTFAVVHDAVTYSFDSLSKEVGSKAIGLTENQNGHTPYINYGINDLAQSAISAPVDVDMEMLATQIHELGNSLALLAGWSPYKAQHAGHQYKTKAGDEDAGVLFEHCVFGGHVSNFGKLEK